MPLACFTFALAASLATGITFSNNDATRVEHRQPASAETEDIVFVSHQLPVKDEINEASSKAIDHVHGTHEKMFRTFSRFFKPEDEENAEKEDKQMELEEDDK